MSKAYLALIAALVVVTLAVGAFAYYRPKASQTPFSPYSPRQPVAPSTPSQNQIALTVTSPTNGQEVSTPTITVLGKTVPNADVSVNDQDVKADAAGNFSVTATLDEGENDIFVTASDQNGNYSEWQATVTYAPAQ